MKYAKCSGEVYKETNKFKIVTDPKLSNYEDSLWHDDNDCSIYVIKHPFCDLIKIGYTKNMIIRLRDFTNSLGMRPLVLLRVVIRPIFDGPAKEIEWGLHQIYKDKRVKGEWFDLTEKDLIDLQYIFWEILEGENLEDNLPTEYNEESCEEIKKQFLKFVYPKWYKEEYKEEAKWDLYHKKPQ